MGAEMAETNAMGADEAAGTDAVGTEAAETDATGANPRS